jgi:predicted transcriptional regulator
MKLRAIFLVIFATLSLNAITVGEIPKEITISDENGGLAKDGTKWSSSTLKNKVYVMFYVDPDEKDTNSHFSDRLKKRQYSKKGDFASIAIVNLAATWKPNFIIEKLLKQKQKDFPDTIYVKDKASVCVKEWGLADDASDILIFSKNGKVLFYKAGKMSEDDIKKSFQIIEENL